MAQVRRSERLRAQRGGGHRSATTIGTLPDDVLLDIFDSYRTQSQDNVPVWPWHLLVHVCRKWRQIIFESPLRLNLQILCTHRTPVRENLSIWPAFPIAINYRSHGRLLGHGNINAALGHPNRVCYISLDMPGSQLDRMAAVMQEPFPVLAHLNVSLDIGYAPVLPANFLGGSAPRLQTFRLDYISFPALPTLLLSATDLVKLELRIIPRNSYISPEAMVASLAALLRLKTFIIELPLVTSRPDRIHPPPVTRTVLPALTYFEFLGASEYLEDLVSRIDGPQLDEIFTVFRNDIQVAQLSEFIDRSLGPKSNQFKIAHFAFYNTGVSFAVYSHASPNRHLVWDTILRKRVDWQASHIHVLSRFSAAFCNVSHLKLVVGLRDDRELEFTDDTEWLHLLRQFSTAQTLHVSPKLAGPVALALEDITVETVTDVLPSLDLICIEGQPASSVEKFVTARRVSGRPVTVVNTEMELNGRLKSYVCNQENVLHRLHTLRCFRTRQF